jgi:hypothetical protein
MEIHQRRGSVCGALALTGVDADRHVAPDAKSASLREETRKEALQARRPSSAPGPPTELTTGQVSKAVANTVRAARSLVYAHCFTAVNGVERIEIPRGIIASATLRCRSFGRVLAPMMSTHRPRSKTRLVPGGPAEQGVSSSPWRPPINA